MQEMKLHCIRIFTWRRQHPYISTDNEQQ